MKKNGFISRRESKPQRSEGFTLAEVLVVIGVLTVMGVILTDIFFRSVRGSSKAELISRIKQNGQTTLDIIDKNLRSADGVVCTDAPTNSTILFVKSGSFIRYKFNSPTPTVNGSIMMDIPTAPDCNAPIVNQTSLTDTDLKDGISVTSASFARNKQAGFKDFIEINFDVSPPVNTPLNLKQQIDPITFKTTVGLR